MAAVEVKVPDIGDFKEVEVIEVLVKAGDRVKLEQSLVTVESDKASMEIPSAAEGVVKELRVKVGDKISEGSLLLMLEADAAPAPAPAVAAEQAAVPVAPAAAPAPALAAVSTPAPAPAPSASGSDVDVVVPDIGDFDEVGVIEVLVKAGDTVQAEQSLITVESDKASMEIPSSHAGVVKSVSVVIGDKVKRGSVIAVVTTTAGMASTAAPNTAPEPAPAASAAAAPPSAALPAASAPADKQVPTAALPAHEPTAPQGTLPHASPSIRKLARELGVPLDEVSGSGPKGRITQDDLQGFVKAVMAGDQQTRTQAAKAPTASAGPVGG
ncbi:MAG: biotin/lipoyl-containing protein, partial [Caldimonas sp.]